MLLWLLACSGDSPDSADPYRCDDAGDHPLLIWYPDRDGDGWGDVAEPHPACLPDATWVLAGPDCAPGDNEVNPAAVEICNGKDDDCDGKIDCADPACVFSPNCTPVAEICNNGLDDDLDGKTDCSDPDCANNPFCVVKQKNCLSPKLIPGSGTYTGDTTGNTSETKGSCGGDAGEAVFYFVLTDP